MDEKSEGMLHGYRVLDLTDEKGWLCGKMLGDLGADVIKIERPGGDPSRNIGPFYHDEPDPEKSLLWFAFNTSKRGITLDIETTDGNKTFKKLVKTTDFIIESFPPGYMDKLGLGYSALEKVNPRIIMVSITPFGQTGPYKDYKGSDIVACAMGGQMFVTGDADRPPVRISQHSQSYLHAGAQAAVGSLMALYHRERTGESQQVDVSIQEAVCWFTGGPSGVDTTNILRKRGESFRTGPQLPMMWPCKDGHVLFGFFFGGERGQRRSGALVQYMTDEGMADDFLKNFKFSDRTYDSLTQEEADKIENQVRKFFISHTKAELLRDALKYDATVYPVATTADMLDNIQLNARNFWVKVEHPELGTSITYPGAFAFISGNPPKISRRAPLIGEHNHEIFKELQKPNQSMNVIREKSPVRFDNEARKRKPLEGVKVVDFSWLVAGPLVGKSLADFGAQVVKIEGRTRPGGWRTLGQFKDNIFDVDRSIAFLPVETSKYSIAVNLAKPAGKEFAKRLIAWADIVSDNYAGGTMDRMGFGYEELKKIKPDIIMVSACMMGQTGPYNVFSGDGNNLTGLAGFTHLAGWPDRDAVSLGIYTDYIGPNYSLASVLAALDYRRRTGKGQRIDLSQYEAGVHFIAPLVLDYAVNKRVANRQGNRYDYAAPHGAYRCHGNDTDRWCAISVFTDEEWRNFCNVIGNPVWTKDNKFTTLIARKENEDELDKLIEEWTLNHSAEKVMSLMQSAGIAAGVVQSVKDMADHDPQLKHRHLFWECNHPVVGMYRTHRPPYILSKTSCEVRYSPLLGEHNEYVLKEILGMSDAEIADLVVAGALE